MTDTTFTITVYDDTVRAEVLSEAVAIYREVYAEPPYLEDEEHFGDFAEDLHRRARQESFRLVLARIGAGPVGFAMGHQLPPTTAWWKGAIDSIPADVTAERPGRTFAVFEIAVRGNLRRRHYGRRLHAHLLAGLHEERVTLLVRPDAIPAQAAYRSWGYHQVGQVRPFANAPIYDVMISPLTARSPRSIARTPEV